jgi:uncharacterized coiled-coil protein SlyX
MRYSLRDLLAITVIVALALGWWTNLERFRRQRSLDRARISELEQRLKTKDSQIATLNSRLAESWAEERALRHELAEFVASQEDKLKIDVAPGYFVRLPPAGPLSRVAAP